MTVKLEQTKIVTDIKKWLLCPRCDSGSVIYRSKTKDYQCRRCGAVFIAVFDDESTSLKTQEN